MPFWKPEKIWDGLDVFIIGGGHSLQSFDWNLLKSEMTIGCNMAFSLGEEICKLCIFGDNKWFKVFESELERYKGIVFTNAPQLAKSRLSWLWIMTRKMNGLHRTALGWNGNTGASAINLALLLGAKRVLLLGFDMKLSKTKKSNWHDRIIQGPRQSVYPKFIEQFGRVASDLTKKFPGCEVINITDDNRLPMFPSINVEEFWNERKSA